MTTIVRDDEIRDGSPRIAGTRITVLDCKRRVIDQNEDPHVVAGEYEITMTALFTALAYYYEHREELADREHAYEAARQEGERRIQTLVSNGAESIEQAD